MEQPILKKTIDYIKCPNCENNIEVNIKNSSAEKTAKLQCLECKTIIWGMIENNETILIISIITHREFDWNDFPSPHLFIQVKRW